MDTGLNDDSERAAATDENLQARVMSSSRT